MFGRLESTFQGLGLVIFFCCKLMRNVFVNPNQIVNVLMLELSLKILSVTSITLCLSGQMSSGISKKKVIEFFATSFLAFDSMIKYAQAVSWLSNFNELCDGFKLLPLTVSNFGS